MSDAVSYERAQELFSYNPETGIIYWKTNRGRNQINGKTAGCVDRHGYVSIYINRKHHSAHRLAWLISHGEYPEFEIDHINGIRNDNRILNLRAVSKSENGKNQKMKSNNKSGVCGVSWYEPSKKWLARIRVNGRYINLGYFEDLDSAAISRKSAEIEYGFHKNHGRVMQ